MALHMMGLLMASRWHAVSTANNAALRLRPADRLAFLLPSSHCFSTTASGRGLAARLRDAVTDRAAAAAAGTPPGAYDATSVPLEGLLFPDPDPDATPATVLSYASDLAERRELSPASYGAFARARHADSVGLFDGYETALLRCEALDDGPSSVNVRWRASWIPAGSTWLYGLADAAGWTVTGRAPDPSTVATFRWGAVFGMFRKALATGDITLPLSIAEGNTVVSIAETTPSVDPDGAGRRVISLSESIDLVSEADAGRLRNRRAAQEVAAWMDVLRRPPGVDALEWASTVRGRMLVGVPGAGALDVDPNDDDAEGRAALVAFAAVSLSAMMLSFGYLVGPEIAGGRDAVPGGCDAAAAARFGSYLVDCFGYFSDPVF